MVKPRLHEARPTERFRKNETPLLELGDLPAPAIEL